MSNELATMNHSFSDMQLMAESIARSGLFGVKSPDHALALMLVAQAEGMHPATVTQDYDIIQGKACRKSHSVMARFQQTGGKVEWHELTDAVADATFSHPSGGKLRMNWTLKQAADAKLTGKDNWKNYPRAMLRARLIAEAIRAIYPAALGGMLLAEEAQDLPTQTEYTPPQVKAIDPSTGEISKALPAMPQPKFDAQLPKWSRAVAEGGKVSDLRSMLASKYTLSPKQLAAINALAKPAAPDADQAGIDEFVNEMGE